jgi:hypothetical protein
MGFIVGSALGQCKKMLGQSVPKEKTFKTYAK